MIAQERARHARKRRHAVITAAVIAATITACDEPTPIVPAADSSPIQRDVTTRERLLPRATAGHRRPAPTHARIGTAVHITIPKVWAELVECEAHGDWRYGAPGHPGDPGYAEYEGGPNYVHSTWTAYKPDGYPAHAYDATPLQQIVVAKRVLLDQGVRAWPVCGPRVGLELSDAA